MSEFKAGDKVMINTNYPDNQYKRVDKGEVGVVLIGDLDGLVQVKFENQVEEVFPYRLHLYVDEKESISKFLREEKWFIRTGSPEKSFAAQTWLFEHGMEWFMGKNTLSDFREKYLTNTSATGELCKYIMHGNSDMNNAQEIKLEYATVVASVQLPEIPPKKTEAQLKIEALEKTIEQAQRELQELKEIK